MGITLPTAGQSAWHTPLDAALEDLQDAGLIANDAGFLSWNYPAYQIIGASSAITSGTVVMAKLPRFTQSKTVASVHFHVAAAAVTPTAGQCFAGLYNAAGTRMGVSADIGSSLTSTGLKAITLSAAAVCPVGDYWVAVLQNAATPATLGVCSSQGVADVMNAGLSAATAFFTDGPTAQTSLPASVTMASRTVSARAVWAGAK